MKSGREEEFREAESRGVWSGEEFARELFNLWMKLRKRVMDDTN